MVRKADGAPDHFVSIIEDIGLRKQAEVLQQRYQDQLRLLINELNHRVKNTLATVQSIATQTFRREGIERETAQAFERRLHALAEAHNVLTVQSWEPAPVRGGGPSGSRARPEGRQGARQAGQAAGSDLRAAPRQLQNLHRAASLAFGYPVELKRFRFLLQRRDQGWN